MLCNHVFRRQRVVDLMDEAIRTIGQGGYVCDNNRRCSCFEMEGNRRLTNGDSLRDQRIKYGDTLHIVVFDPAVQGIFPFTNVKRRYKYIETNV